LNRYLLNKGVVRRTVEALFKIALDLYLTSEQEQALNVLRHVATYHEAFITIETFHILKTKISKIPSSEIILSLTEVLVPVRYSRRWARRLRDQNFSGEDAKLLSMATFGTDKIIGGTFLGLDAIITFDRHLAEKFNADIDIINERFQSLISSLKEPYSNAHLPEVITVGRFLEDII